MAHDDAATQMTELFDPEPEQWGLRGDPHVWRALCDYLSGTELPASVDEVNSLLRRAFSDVVGVDLDTERESPVYREQYAHGGMSSGYVDLGTWHERLLPLLAKRAKALIEA